MSASPAVGIYDGSRVEEIPWPATDEGAYARRALVPFLRDGPTRYIRNVRTTLYVLRVGDVVLPLSAGPFEPANSYVCSPYNHYVTYALDEARLLGQPGAAAMRLLLRPLGWFLRRHEFDRVLYVNNWLLSTNLYPPLEPGVVAEVMPQLVEHFPDRAILWRSVDRFRNPALVAALERAGARLIFSRQVYYQEAGSPWVRGKKQVRIDQKHLQRSPYRLVGKEALRSPGAIRRVVELYGDLYLRKYSEHNPQFTESFVALALDEGLLALRGFEREGRLDAVLGYVRRNGVITPPLFGYDTSLPQSLGLYRLLSAQVTQEAERQGALVHFSAGVGHFKRLRGARAATEYNALFDGHLPPHRRRPWRLLQALLDRVALPLIQAKGF